MLRLLNTSSERRRSTIMTARGMILQRIDPLESHRGESARAQDSAIVGSKATLHKFV